MLSTFLKKFYSIRELYYISGAKIKSKHILSYPNKIISNPKNKIVTKRKIIKALIDWANFLTYLVLTKIQDIILIYMLSSNYKLL